MKKRVSIPRLKLKGEGGGLKHYARKYWYVFALIGIFLVSWWLRTIPGRWNELIGLDEFHIYRMAQYALTHNLGMYNSSNLDMMRYSPLGVSTWDIEYPLPIYLPVFAYIFFSAIGIAMPFFEFAIFFPAFMGAVGAIIAFFIAKELFKNNVSGIFAAFFVSMTPALFTRTSAASFEKEATAVIFMMAAIWLFLKSYNKAGKSAWFYGILSGVSLALMGMAWGGVQYIYLLFAAFLFVLFGANVILVALDYLFSGFGKHIEGLEKLMGPHMLEAYAPLILLGTILPLFAPLHMELTSMPILTAYSVLAVLVIRYGVLRFNLVKKEKSHYVVPALMLVGAIMVLAGMVFTDFFDNLIASFFSLLSLSKSVIGSTVAENAPGDWNTILSTLGTSFSSGVLPQMSSFSWIFAVSVFMFLGAFVLIYEFFRTRNWLLIFPLVWVASTAYSVFWMVRLLFILGPAAGIVAGFFFGWLIEKLSKTKYLKAKTLRDTINFVTVPLAIFLILTIVVNLAGTYAYAMSINTAICFPRADSSGNIIPCITLDQNGNEVMSLDGQPWYQAMDFLANKTPNGSVVLSWWDFGYWFQVRGQRPSVADGGNLGGKYLRNYGLAEWYTDKAENWSGWVPWMQKYNVSYIFMDYTLPGKYGAITTIASRGENPQGFLEFQKSGMYPKDNTTTVEYTNGVYAIWLPFDNNGALTGPPMFLVSQNGKYYSKNYINDVCTTNGIIRVGNESQAMPGCVSISNLGVFYIPEQAEHTIFVDLMFMQGYGLPVEKVFDNTAVQIYKVRYDMSIAPVG
jgi:dolichyl-diphosphooligosaccharide--protein glycosyltransferase